MEEPQEHAQDIVIEEEEGSSWVEKCMYAFLVLAGQAAGTILGRVYFTNGGNSQWMGTLVQVAGFPILLPIQWMLSSKPSKSEPNSRRYHTYLASIYTGLGIFVALNFWLYTIGLQYLPVSTFTLFSATQLAFNAFFSYFLNDEKITHCMINSVVLLTISSALLGLQTDPGDSKKATHSHYIKGAICTLAASAFYALLLSLTQRAQQRCIQKKTTRAILDMSIYQNLVASIIIMVGLFASEEWKNLPIEMANFKTGSAAYILNLVFTAVAWQIFTLGTVGLIYKVSSFFSNVIGIVGLPLGPFLSMFFLHDKMTGLKYMSMGLAIWGSASYTYQNYSDGQKEKKKKKKKQKKSLDRASQVSLAGIV